MSLLEKSNFQKSIEIIVSSLFLSCIPFGLLCYNFGFYEVFLLVPIGGLVFGIYWVNKVRKKKIFEDYSSDALMKNNENHQMKN